MRSQKVYLKTNDQLLVVIIISFLNASLHLLSSREEPSCVEFETNRGNCGWGMCYIFAAAAKADSNIWLSLLWLWCELLWWNASVLLQCSILKIRNPAWFYIPTNCRAHNGSTYCSPGWQCFITVHCWLEWYWHQTGKTENIASYRTAIVSS